MKSAEPVLRLAAHNEPEALQAEFLKKNRLHIPNVLEPESADAIYNCLATQREWNLACTVNDRHMDMNANAVAELPPEQRREFEKLIYQKAHDGFQYYYKTIPIYDMYHKCLVPGHYLHQVFEFINSPDVLDFFRIVAADESIEFTDGMATCFEPGHFLTRHDDNVSGKNRRAAFVLNFTPRWNPDWGGSLQFFDGEGNTEVAFAPAYNALNMFRIPAPHSVAFVTPFATAPRLSIVGFLRSGKDPMQT